MLRKIEFIISIQKNIKYFVSNKWSNDYLGVEMAQTQSKITIGV